MLPLLIKHGYIKANYQWWARNTNGSLAAVNDYCHRAVKCFRLTTAIFLLKIAIRWATLKIGSLDLNIQLRLIPVTVRVQAQIITNTDRIFRQMSWNPLVGCQLNINSIKVLVHYCNTLWCLPVLFIST